METMTLVVDWWKNLHIREFY